ncbi:histidine kinase [Malonomonas rubra DSM 5091]|uniref:histidine kinase n=1 Tax=Malonomonas rubra DSM 5091 TaxID=1122189 RepID=A0A1M6I7K2_MALRU|nr:ATP-binding protein [Malonomonas rubra]SHJ30382.1 histidine kinase [Malonomonas rubra DSM 5091]
MKLRLLWKLMLITILPVVGVIFLIVWFSVDNLAAHYFMALMEKYDVAVDDVHRMFIGSIHRYLVWASLAALALAFVLSYLLTRRVLRPLQQMTAITREVAAGNYSLRAEVTTGDEVGQLGEAFNSMADSLEQVERLRKTMVADVAHELRTPLTNLRGYLEALNDGVIPPTSDTLQMLQQESLRLVHLVESLQQLARADAAKAYLKRETVLLSDLVGHLLTLGQLNFQKKEIEIETDYSALERPVKVDKDKILQAMQNMLDNACKYTPHGGSVRVAVTPVEDGMKVVFQNTGPDIPAADLPYIFERFFRADRSRSRIGGGAGIGLAISRELIAAHGGQVGAESSEGKTEVWLIVPE